jgi:hypothetical protein
VQRLLYFYFKETEITKINSFVPEVRNICPKGGTNYFNIRWKLIANEILYVLMKTFNQNNYACELNQTTGMAQRAHTAQMILKLIINRTNTFLRFKVPRYVPFFFTLKNLECPVFSFQKSGHPIIISVVNEVHQSMW